MAWQFAWFWDCRGRSKTLATSPSFASVARPEAVCIILTETACLSIIMAVTVAMIAIGIQRPDMGNVLAVRPDVSLIKGLGPVLNIILAYSRFQRFE